MTCTNKSFRWIGEHWLGVVVISTLAAVSGWAVGRQHQDNVSGLEKEQFVDQERSAVAPHPVANSTEYSAEVTDRTTTEGVELDHGSSETQAHVSLESFATEFSNGTDGERLAALTQALQYGIEIQPQLLIDAYLNDPSEDVRLLAFTTYVDSVSDEVEVVRAALQSATNNTSPIVQAEADRRLAELTNYEAAVAATIAQDAP